MPRPDCGLRGRQDDRADAIVSSRFELIHNAWQFERGSAGERLAGSTQPQPLTFGRIQQRPFLFGLSTPNFAHGKIIALSRREPRMRHCLATVVIAPLFLMSPPSHGGVGFWCEPAHAYYPTVPSCPVPWRQIAQPDPSSDPQSAPMTRTRPMQQGAPSPHIVSREESDAAERDKAARAAADLQKERADNETWFKSAQAHASDAVLSLENRYLESYQLLGQRSRANMCFSSGQDIALLESNTLLSRSVDQDGASLSRNDLALVHSYLERISMVRGDPCVGLR